jgi:hypothetical protein
VSRASFVNHGMAKPHTSVTTNAARPMNRSRRCRCR